ncbi:hypothetical protein HPB50_024545 [Hyalomma asiaticum]|uniref:Uncharacterized protein n=1 Tax=Hyalomma asiaticum TaxID=266040 RepID=A0ACB7SL33_HYAAI|nr:hypothetical protein HPB50_024545 [Hyalomma asiaticum]
MDNVTIREMWSIMGASVCVFVVMIVYLSKVLPWSTANPQHLFFPLMRSYWAPREATFTEMLPAAPDMQRFQHRPAFGIVINCKDVVKTFGSAVALDKVSMTIHKFQATVLLGHNGAGKTTLMSIFTGLLAPDSGNVTVFGHRASDPETRKNMGFCPQMDAFFDDLTVSDHLTYFGLLKGMNSSKIKANVAALLKTVQLSDKPDALPSELSGGMKRRLSIAIALISKPQLLILDEPTVGLDPDARRVVWKILRDLRGNTTVLFSTHDMDEAEALADRIIVMYSGTVVSWGTPMFIKDACSVGFRLRISKVPNAFNSKAVLSTILKAAPMATLDDDNENEAVFVLNTMYREGFVDMFSELEANGQTMGIKNIGVSVATMKEAYIKIYKEWVGDAKKDLPPQKEVSEPVVVAPRQPNIIQRFRALVQKRLLVLRRSPFLFITGWVLPVLVAFVGFSVVKQSSLNVPAEYQHIDLDAAAYVDADHGSPLKTFLQINNATNTSLGYRVLLESENVPFDELKNSKEALQAMFEENFLEYARAYAFGAVFNATALELWSNPFGVVAQGVLRNLIDTVLLRQHTGQARSRFSTGISLYRLTDEELYSEGPPRDPLFSLRQHLVYTWAYWAFMGSVCFGLILSSFVVLPSLEVVTGALELQLMTGVSASLLVTALAFAPLGILLAYMAAEHSSDGGTAYAIVLGLFAIAGKYSQEGKTSALYRVHASKSAATRLYSLWLGCSLLVEGPGVICGYLMAAFHSAGETTRLPFMFFPPFALSATTVRVVNLKYEVTMCDYLRSKKKLKQKHFEFCNRTRYLGATIKYCCDILANKTNDVWTEPYALSFSPRGILQDVVIMLVMGAALFAYLLHRVSGWSQIGREMSAPPQQATKGPVDDDVAAERAAVADICRQQRFGDAGNALVAQELHKVFGTVHAVRGLSFTLKPAECFGLLGVNGAGKTTTFRMLAGLLQMTYGEAYMKESVLSRDTRKWQSRLGYCPQVAALLGKLSAYETLYLFGRLRGVPEDKLAAVVENMINAVDLRDHAARMCNYYSGGDTRKLSMAVAMIGFPEVVLLDEPYDGVDVMGRERIRRSLGKIKSTVQSTVVLTSHSMDECELACDRLCIMVEGEMVCLGTLQHIKDKFGRGYKLIFVRSDKVTVGPQALTESIVNAFPGITLVDVQWKCIECRTQDKLPWSQLFQKIDALDEHYGFEYVFVSDNTLDQIFIAFARKAQESKAGGDGSARRKR